MIWKHTMEIGNKNCIFKSVKCHWKQKAWFRNNQLRLETYSVDFRSRNSSLCFQCQITVSKPSILLSIPFQCFQITVFWVLAFKFEMTPAVAKYRLVYSNFSVLQSFLLERGGFMNLKSPVNWACEVQIFEHVVIRQNRHSPEYRDSQGPYS